MSERESEQERSLMRCGRCGVGFTGRPGDRCPRCRQQVGKRRGLPWQPGQRVRLGRARALWLTILMLHRRPFESFIEMEQRDDTGRSEDFYTDLFLAVMIVRMAVGVLLLGFLFMYATKKAEPLVLLLPLVLVGGFLGAWFIGGVLCHITAVLLRGTLPLVGAAPVAHGALINAIMYSLGAAYAWWAVPVLGAFLSLLSACYVATNAVSALHGIDRSRAAVALLPFYAALAGAHSLVLWAVWRTVTA